jgi:hypothetical protein
VAWKLTVRAGPRVERTRFDDFQAAMNALETRGITLTRERPPDPVDAKFKRFEPSQQVTARLELAGPERFIASARGGVDVRGDGSVEAYVGRVTRTAVEQRSGESAFEALRRALAQR